MSIEEILTEDQLGRIDAIRESMKAKFGKDYSRELLVRQCVGDGLLALEEGYGMHGNYTRKLYSFALGVFDRHGYIPTMDEDGRLGERP